MNIVITGFIGTGKTTVGRLLARRLGRNHLDTDELIEKETGLTVREIFKNYGESYFRKLERKAIRKIVREENDLVISTGGKTLLDEVNLELILKTGIVLCLEDLPENIWPRLKSEATRPVIDGFSLEDFIKLYRERLPGYQKLPNKIQVTGLSALEVAARLESFLNQEVTGFEVHLGSDRTRVSLKRFIRWSSEEVMKNGQGQAFFVVDRQLLKHHKNILGFNNERLFEIPATDSHKNLRQAEAIWRWLLASGVKRDSILVSIGGGVVGDICGFVASTILRGITHLHLPTTLLAMVDSCLGGKNGINLGKIKNCVGTFYPPELVMVNPFFLCSLPFSEIASGLVEVIKAGLISDLGLIDLVEENLELIKKRDVRILEELILRAMMVKKRIVEQDPYESGLRKQLNLGHTVGHALEACSSFKISHGQAVALGLIFSLGLSERLGLDPGNYKERIKNIIQQLGLRTEIEAAEEEIFNLMKYDKKSTATGLDFVLFDVRKGIVIRKVERKLIEDSLREVLVENTDSERTKSQSPRGT